MAAARAPAPRSCSHRLAGRGRQRRSCVLLNQMGMGKWQGDEMKISTKRAFQPAASKRKKKKASSFGSKSRRKPVLLQGAHTCCHCLGQTVNMWQGQETNSRAQQTHPRGATLTDNDKIVFSTCCSALPTLSALRLAGKERYMTEQGQDRQKTPDTLTTSFFYTCTD